MYVVHVVQAHANVRPRAQSCSVATSAYGASRASRNLLHSQSSSSSNREQHIIYMPPPQEQQALVSINSSSRSLAFRPHSGPMPLATVRPASSNTTSPNLRKAAGMLAKLAAPWQRTTALAAVKPSGSSCSSSGTAISAGNSSMLAGQMIICLPDGSGLLLNNSSTLSPAAAADPKTPEGWLATSSSSTVSCKLPAAAFPAAVMLHQPAAAAVAHPNERQLISRMSRSSAAGANLQCPSSAQLPAAAWVEQWRKTPAAAAVKAAASAQPWGQLSARGAASEAVWSAVSSGKITATPAFSIPGYYYKPSSSSGSAFGAGGSDWGGPLGGGSGNSSNNSGSGSNSNSKPVAGHRSGGRPAAAAAAGGGRGSTFGVLPAAPVRLAKLGVGLMGLAAAAALASMYWDDSRRARDIDAARATAVVIDSAAAAAVGGTHEAAAAAAAISGGPGAADTPGFHEWMVRRLQATLQQFDAEQKLLQKELQMLQAIRSRHSKATAAGYIDATAGSSSSSGTAGWSRVGRWLGFTGTTSSSSSAASQQQHAAAVGGSEDAAGDWSPAGIATRMADIKEQIESLDVLKAALAAEAAEQQRQQLKAAAAHD